MATVAIAPDQDVINAEIQIAGPPARVFAALTDPEQVPQWWGQQGMYRITRWQNDLRAGGKWRSEGAGADGTTFHVEGEYLEIDPPRLLVHSWKSSWCGGLNTIVRWELEARQGGTLVKLSHSGFAGNVQAASDHSQGWSRVLVWMEAFVEEGRTVDTRGA